MKPPNSFKLQPELVPEPLWSISAHRLFGHTKPWELIRKRALEEAANCCSVCETAGSRLSCHDRWHYDDKKGVATLVGFAVLCADCHGATHIGRAVAHGFGEEALAQLCRVNGITFAAAERMLERAMKVWEIRSREKWRVAVEKNLLETYPRLHELVGGGDRFPSGWNESRVKGVLEHYEEQLEAEAVAEDEMGAGMAKRKIQYFGKAT